ncbi:hypothetical protein J4407_03420 [Candidatus Pacearchaeota archaeon]|nr:hypothetical protein [Candidatus Pacearchaeota archaeon]
MSKTTKSFRVDPELWKEVKVYVAKSDNLDISSFIEQAIKEKLGKKK